MKRKPVESSNICAIGYDPASKILELEFGIGVDMGHSTNRLYQYFDVPFEVHRDLMDAPSKGEELYYKVSYKFKYQYLGTIADEEG